MVMKKIRFPGRKFSTFNGGVVSNFEHHAKGVARLNHGSFGAVPQCVLEVQDKYRRQLLAQPDEYFFSGRLQEKLRRSSQACARDIGATEDQVCLVENATVATAIIAQRWARMARTEDHALVLSVAYGPCRVAVQAAIKGNLVISEVPFPRCSRSIVLQNLEDALKKRKIRFALLDHISSQPSFLLPIQEMVLLCRQYGVEEIAVDGSHSIGSCSVDVKQMGADWFFSNLHKWAYAPPTATVLQAAPELLRDTHHPILSWNYPKGLLEECLFTGSRDYSAMLAVPAALEFLREWRSEEGEVAAVYCRRRVLEAARKLAHSWGTELTEPAELTATQCMIQLPYDLPVTDIPGVPSHGVRSQLRDRFGIEAAIGCFGEKGNFIRLSYAIYNTEDEIDRLDRAVHTLLHEATK